MHDFTGFPPGHLTCTPIPDAFLGSVLPSIDDLAELKVTLYLFWKLHQRRGFPRFLTRREMEGDRLLLRSVDGQRGQEPGEGLGRALGRAVERGTFVRLAVEVGGRPEEIYLVNDGRGREAVERLRRGEIDLGDHTVVVEPAPEPRPERSSIFDLYEQNFGLLTPLIVDELVEAQKVYPQDWIVDAFRAAVEYNRRNWRYVRRILERWAVEGKR